MGLIPAHAGKTPRRAGGSEIATAHPRSRGENTPFPTDCVSVTGSSPLTRGKPVDEGFEGGHVGLIPAHAGKT